MNLRLLVIALIAALGSSCASNDKPRSALKVEPVSTVRHGGATAQSFYQLARYYHGQQRYAQAEAAYRKAIAADGAHADAYNGLAILYADRGQLERSVQTFSKALTIAPRLAYVHNNLGYAYLLQKRYDDAYAAVREALTLDPALVRGWSNLEQIATARSDTLLAEAAKARRLAALPENVVAGRLTAGTDANAAPTMVVSPPAAVAAGVEAATPPAIQLVESGAAGVLDARGGTENTVAPVTAESPVASRPVEMAEPPASTAKFVLVSANDEVTLQVAPVAMMAPAPLPAEPSAAKRIEAELNLAAFPVRLEVSNGNGVTGFAKRFAAVLRGNDVPVRRITNYDRFTVKESLVEFQPGYESAARALMLKANLEAQVQPAKSARPGSDVRIVLGRDAVQARGPASGVTVSQAASPLTSPADSKPAS